MVELVVMMDHLGLENMAGPTLGLLISLYAITTGSAFFLIQSWSLNNTVRTNNIFHAINISFGSLMFLSMILVRMSLVRWMVTVCCLDRTGGRGLTGQYYRSLSWLCPPAAGPGPTLLPDEESNILMICLYCISPRVFQSTVL